MLLEGLVDIQHRVLRFVKAGQQLVDYDDELEIGIVLKAVNHISRVVFLTLAADILFPPGLDFRLLALIHFRMAFARIGRAHDDGTLEQTNLVQIPFVADGGELAVTGQHALDAEISQKGCTSG
ncbi:hypothetical protein NBRC3284_2848 [Acetobacter pasteurianus NBRC 3284]|nr:hypothetical protein NBRC3284_2848 [Acetobacter pasteurianus NBRC 3284]